jgi:hypothetical protein
MLWPIDIFQVRNDGRVMWLEAVKSLQDAKVRVACLALETDSAFIVLNQVTGTRYHIPDPSGPWTTLPTDKKESLADSAKSQ